MGGLVMEIKLVSNEKIAETSSKGNQEKWYDKETDCWYKLDQFGYESLAETVISEFLEDSNIETDTPFTFVRYGMTRFRVHGRDRTGCVSRNFLKDGESIVTLNRLLTLYLGCPLKEKLMKLTSDKKRVEYLANTTAEITKLADFPKYLTLVFEVDSLFLNDDRHLNNIAVIEKDGRYSYCPVFDNGAGLLSGVSFLPFDIAPKALVKDAVARPMGTSFTRQMNTARGFTGPVLKIRKYDRAEIADRVKPLLDYYPKRDRELILDRVEECILERQKLFSL